VAPPNAPGPTYVSLDYQVRVYADLTWCREMVMRIATLISWLLTASLGGFMLRTWIAAGGLRRERARPGGLPPQLIFGHAGLAITGLAIWSGYVASGIGALAWTAVAALMVTIGLGLSTVTLWTPYPARRPAVVPDTAAGAAGGEADPLDYQITDEMIARLLEDPPTGPGYRAIRPDPAILVPVAHGFAAIGTFILAVMTASMALPQADSCGSRPGCRYFWGG
jgi:hypothetical protein